MIISPFGPFYMAPGGGPTDPLWSFVVALLQPGAGASSYTTDETGKAVTLVGDAALSSTTPFGDIKSFALDGGADFVRLGDSSSWAFGTDLLTIEVMVRPTATSTNRQVFFQGPDLSNNITCYLNTTDFPVFQVTSGGSNLVSITGTTALTTSSWNYLGITRRTGNEWAVKVNSGSENTATASISVPDFSGNWDWGGIDGVGNYMTGQMTMMRITRGASRTLISPATSYPVS